MGPSGRSVLLESKTPIVLVSSPCIMRCRQGSERPGVLWWEVIMEALDMAHIYKVKQNQVNLENRSLLQNMECPKIPFQEENTCRITVIVVAS